VTFGRSCIVPDHVLPACVNQHVSIIRPDPKKCCSGYLLCYLTHPVIKDYIESFNSGGSRRAVTKGHIESFEVPLPPLPVQESIAKLLGRLDEKIESNRRMNRTLEAMARAIFQSWFVDFDPVRAKVDGRAPAGMDAATAALFTDHFEDSDLGKVPDGWKTAPLDQIASFLNGLALQKYPPVPEQGTLPVIKIAQLRAGNIQGADLASNAVPSPYIVEDGDLLFSWSGSLMVDFWCGGRGALNQHLFKVTSSRFPLWFIHRWILEYLPTFQGIAADKATTMGHIQRRHLTEAKVILPPEGILRVADGILGKLQAKQLQNNLESRTLAALRDTLLPKLISGELRVSEAEDRISEAV
jgi:type I restriction enzyme, S subunit